MKLKILLRPSIAIVFGFLGVFITRGAIPDVFASVSTYFLAVAFLAFATLGFILPDILELAGKAGISALARQISELIPNPRSVSRIAFRRGRKKSVRKLENALVVDTSVLIDGRILEVAKSGFITGTFVVIPAVIGELQKLADNYDDIKRVRGRRGLDILRSLSKVRRIRIDIPKNEPTLGEVDDKLLETAKKFSARLLTVDFNLNKVGKVRGVEILNVNELANALKTSVLPNDHLNILVSAKGKENDQGVGYLDDGTMVVVEHGLGSRGKQVRVLVRKVIQTNAGKMIFARVASHK